jgi:hypothetical protein
MATEITKAKMLQLYDDGLTSHEVNTGNRLYAHSHEGQALNPKGFIVVWCAI